MSRAQSIIIRNKQPSAHKHFKGKNAKQFDAQTNHNEIEISQTAHGLQIFVTIVISTSIKNNQF